MAYTKSFRSSFRETCLIARGLEAREAFLEFSSLTEVREAERREAFLGFSPFRLRAPRFGGLEPAEAYEVSGGGSATTLVIGERAACRRSTAIFFSSGPRFS